MSAKKAHAVVPHPYGDEMHAMKARQEEKLLPSIRKNLSGMSEAEPEAKLPKVKDERPVSLRPWQVQAREARRQEEYLSWIEMRFREIYMEVDGLSAAERTAKLLQSEEELAYLSRELSRVNDEIKIPDYSGMTEEERAEEAARLKQEELERVHRLKLEGNPHVLQLECSAHTTDFDPKAGGHYSNRPTFLYLTDLDEESPIGPMRFTNVPYQDDDDTVLLYKAVNILTVKIACSDVGFPIQVYGTVIARDSIDCKCIYLFRRERDNCQIITSEDDPLILTGPKRALVLGDYNFVETDLKIKNHQGHDRELSKGFFSIRGLARTSMDCTVGSIATRLSTVDVMYAVVIRAVEATIAVKVIVGKFHGTITAHTTNIQKSIVLYDSKVAGVKIVEGRAYIPMMRSALPVHWKDTLIIVVETPDVESKCLKFAPKSSRVDRVWTTLGAVKVVVEVSWSILMSEA